MQRSATVVLVLALALTGLSGVLGKLGDDAFRAPSSRSRFGGSRTLLRDAPDSAVAAARPGIQNCTEKFFTQRLDHFGFRNPQVKTAAPYSFQQRYFVCGQQYWRPGQPIFFYTGNEANVELFVNMTGLMWENALEVVLQIREPQAELPRLKTILKTAQDFGWGFTDQMNDLFALFMEKLEATS